MPKISQGEYYRHATDLATYSDRICEILDAAKVDLVILAGFLSFWHIPDRYLGLHVLHGELAAAPDHVRVRRRGHRRERRAARHRCRWDVDPHHARSAERQLLE